MIRFGLTGWNRHDALYPPLTKDKLQAYCAHFPIVEVDSSFYAVQPARNFEKWARVTPDEFAFVVKAYQGMTGHLRGEHPFASAKEMFEAFLGSIRPVVEAGKLKVVLFQYPPWFECNRQNVDALRYTRERIGDVPVALEFRHQSWFTPQMRERTLQFMEREGWIHSIADEPQAGKGSIPIVLHPTSRRMTLVRFHGRNVQGWNKTGGDEEWREVRYLYCYSREELLEWKERIEQLQTESEEICILFNNNSGGDAGPNAKDLMRLLGVEYEGKVSGQMNLFDSL